MFRRRRRDDADPTTDPEATTDAEEASDDPAKAGAGSTAPASGRADGPYDSTEVDLEDEAELAGRVDLGGLLIRGQDGMALQLQVEEGTEQVQAALVVIEDSAVQLLAVAAPRSSGLWAETREEITADATAQGATVEEAEGPFGTELRILLPVVLPDGEEGVQPSRVIGIDGRRWMLRATFLGRATLEDDAFDALAGVVRDVVVVRGDAPMAPGDLIALRLPEEIEPVAGDEGEDAGEGDRLTLEDLDPGPTTTEIR